MLVMAFALGGVTLAVSAVMVGIHRALRGYAPNRNDPAGRDSRVVFSIVVVPSTTRSGQVSIPRCG